MTQSFGTLSLPILGSCGAATVLSSGALEPVDFAGVGEAGGCAVGALNRLELPLEEPGRLAKGFEASFAGGCWAGVS